MRTKAPLVQNLNALVWFRACMYHDGPIFQVDTGTVNKIEHVYPDSPSFASLHSGITDFVSWYILSEQDSIADINSKLVECGDHFIKLQQR